MVAFLLGAPGYVRDIMRRATDLRQMKSDLRDCSPATSVIRVAREYSNHSATSRKIPMLGAHAEFPCADGIVLPDQREQLRLERVLDVGDRRLGLLATAGAPLLDLGKALHTGVRRTWLRFIPVAVFLADHQVHGGSIVAGGKLDSHVIRRRHR